MSDSVRLDPFDMPWVKESCYRAPGLLSNGHVMTIYASLFRPEISVPYERVRVELPDGDFLDVDRSSVGSDSAVILCHGLESSSKVHYITSLVRQFNWAGLDACAMNFRGCGGEPNRLPRSYHSGDTDDLASVIAHIAARFPYQRLFLAGFSLGGNVVLKYMGESRDRSSIAGAAAVSVPCDLAGSARRLESFINRIYMRRFIRQLATKLAAKNDRLDDRFDLREFRRMRTFAEFDEAYTAPVHGFLSAHDYWARSSSLGFLGTIDRPTLLINAKDDPFLSESCYPVQIAENHSSFTLETPLHGGHVGFLNQIDPRRGSWYESRMIAFFRAARD